jgi:hypothetical protein
MCRIVAAANGAESESVDHAAVSLSIAKPWAWLPDGAMFRDAEARSCSGSGAQGLGTACTNLHETQVGELLRRHPTQVALAFVSSVELRASQSTLSSYTQLSRWRCLCQSHNVPHSSKSFNTGTPQAEPESSPTKTVGFVGPLREPTNRGFKSDGAWLTHSSQERPAGFSTRR